MAGRVHTYDPRQLTITVGGFLLSGFADDEVLRVARDDDLFFKRVGVAGEVARVMNLNQAGSISVSLMQSSPSNDDLSVLASLDQATSGLAGAVPILVRDKSGRSVFVSATGWVKRFPDSVYSRDPSVREWTLDCSTLLIFVGGN